MWKRVAWGVVILILGVSSAVAQDDARVVIDAENIDQLKSVAQVDFNELSSDLGEVINGGFVMNNNSSYLAVTNRTGDILLWDDQRGLTRLLPRTFLGTDGLPATFLKADFLLNTKTIAALYTDGELHYAITFTQGFGGRVEKVDGMVDDLWIGNEPGDLWIDDGTQIFQLTIDFDPIARSVSADSESVIRIGRIEPPLAVTVTEDGRVKRWNMETGEVTAEVQVDAEDGLPIYGALNAGGDSNLVWRDPASKAFHILNFETGEDRIVVPLNGSYIPFIFLTQQSDVIIGVNIDDEPIVVAWNAATGERYDLGAYRQCNRPPDMVRLSQDGTTLVIGCDTGLDIWRINE